MKRFFTLITGATLIAGVGATVWAQGGQSGGGGASGERVPREHLVRRGRLLETRAEPARRMSQAAAALPLPARAGQASCKAGQASCKAGQAKCKAAQVKCKVGLANCKAGQANCKTAPCPGTKPQASSLASISMAPPKLLGSTIKVPANNSI